MELLKDNPRELSRCYQIGSMLKETPEEQLELLDKALELDANNVDALRGRALIYLITQKPMKPSRTFSDWPKWTPPTCRPSRRSPSS
ncbi:MAG: tetratricopeptide repeat protein [Pirellulaceae bacterium]